MATFARGLILAGLLLSGCAYSPEVTFLFGPKRIEGDVQDLGASITVIQRFGEKGRAVCGWDHLSDPLHGPPFNGEAEVTGDLGGCGFRVGGNRR